MNKVELLLKGLDCAHCASKIESKVKDISEVNNAYVNFIDKKLFVEIEDYQHIAAAIDEAEKIIKKLEPHVEVIIINKNKKALNSQHKSENEHGHDHEHDHNHNHDHDGFEISEFIALGSGVLLFIIGVIFNFSFWLELTIYLSSYMLVGGEVLIKSIKNILRGQVFDENFLMSIATIGAFAIGEFPEGVAVMLFYQIGELFQGAAVNRSRKSIKALMDIRPDYANLRQGNDIIRVSPEDVSVGDFIAVRPGERIPLDGQIVEGESMVDTSALTGESVPRKVTAEDEVLSGFVNKNGLLIIKVQKEFGESTVSKILDLVQNASSKKAPTENFITKFARYYTPAVVFIALALAVLPPIIIRGEVFSEWLYRALVFLVVSCPCALVVSIPLGFFGGIGGASRNGILIKGSNYLEALNNVDTIAFDKTGTLTKGVFKVTELKPASGFSKEELLEYAAYAEGYSTHPIGISILKAYGKTLDKSRIESYEEVAGHGIKARISGEAVALGNSKLMQLEAVEYDKAAEGADTIGSLIYVAVDNKYCGHLIISDELKEDAKKAIAELRKIGVKNIVMLTGDTKPAAEGIGKILDIDNIYSELLPHEKVEKLEYLEKSKSTKGKLIFVGDGINDAPVLARADIGIAMGGLGSDAAIEAADVVIMTDEPSKIAAAVSIAKYTKAIVWQNIILAFTIKLIVLALGAGGIATMWEAVFADVGVALLAVLNAMRVLSMKKL